MWVWGDARVGFVGFCSIMMFGFEGVYGPLFVQFFNIGFAIWVIFYCIVEVSISSNAALEFPFGV